MKHAVAVPRRMGMGQRRTRCKYVHVSSMAPSMAPTVLRCPMPIRIKRLRLLLPPGSREKKDQIKFKFKFKGKSRSRDSWLCFCFCPLLRLAVRRVRARRNCRGEAGRAAQDREAHGCADRAYMDAFTACPAARPAPHASVKAPNASTPRLARIHQIPEEDRVDQQPVRPCQYFRCAGSSANSTTLPCPCADTSSHALPATRARLRSER